MVMFVVTVGAAVGAAVVAQVDCLRGGQVVGYRGAKCSSL